MVSVLLFHGIFFVAFLYVYSRWLDEETLAEVCFFSLFFELVFSLMLSRYVQASDAVFFLHLGSVSYDLLGCDLCYLFVFDELAGVFLTILLLALFFCFFFLLEYFEYEVRSQGIIFLSAIFSQLALAFFCSYDTLSMLIFWEFISLVSFFLVQHWSSRLATIRAGLKVFSISQAGDLPFFFFFFLSLSYFNTTDVSVLLSLLPTCQFSYIPLFGFLFQLTSVLAFTLSFAFLLKAAQWFFYPWLLDAMEAPVPISAQLHSSTLVIIGFYLFYRFETLFSLAHFVLTFLIFVGVVSAVGACLLAYNQHDGKRLLACSTASQLGYVVTVLGLGLGEEALYLLAFCCCNKALTFVWLGVLMRRYGGLSDFRLLGGASKLAWLEHVGLVLALSNFTIIFGAQSWHIKGLFGLGFPLKDLSITKLALSFLQLTWFFTSLYLFKLYVSLFRKPLGVKKDLTSKESSLFNRAGLSLAWSFFVKKSMIVFFAVARISLNNVFLVSFLLIQAVLLVWAAGFGCFFFDVSWVTQNSFVSLSYY